MPRIVVTKRNGEVREINAQSGISVMESIRDEGIVELLAICGGCCSCATCHIYVDPAFVGGLTTPSDTERDLLDAAEHTKPTSRLSCQLKTSDVVDGFKVTIAPED